jgi:hypothetical protein
MKVIGENNLVEANTISFCTFDCIDAPNSGGGHTITGNDLSECGHAGIDVGIGPIVVDGNTITDVQGEGIAVTTSDSGVQISNNVVVGSRTDICNDKGATLIFSGNTYTTGGPTTVCVRNR